MVEQIHSQAHNIFLTIQKCKRSSERLGRGKRFLNDQAKSVNELASPKMKRMIELASEKGASSWLTIVSALKMDFTLNKQEFRDALKLRYDWPFKDNPTRCACGDLFNIDHAMICRLGGFIIQHHNELRDLEADLLNIVCNDVQVEPALQEIHGKALNKKKYMVKLIMLKSKLECDKNAYRKVRDDYSALLNDTRRMFYSNLIDKSAGDSRKLFQIVNSMSKERLVEEFPENRDPSILANEFGEFFCKKIDVLKSKIDEISINPPDVPFHLPEVKLDEFSSVSEDEVRRIILESSNASSRLDPIPTSLVKLCCHELAPIIAEIINLSFAEGIVPDHWKRALVLPILKKFGLDFMFENFRPISNLPFVAKSAEKATISQLSIHCVENVPFPECQSAYRKNHSTETALLKIQNDILLSIYRQEVTLLVLIDISAAFDTIDHAILLETLEKDFGVTGNALKWLTSYLSERKQTILIKDHESEVFNLQSGVPQGSCLGPVLFILYVAGLFKVIDKHLPNAHTYADDTQIYHSFRPDTLLSQDAALKSIENCVADIRAWMLSNRLLINDSKTEFIIIGSKQQLSKININEIRVGESTIEPVEVVQTLECGLTHICRWIFILGKYVARRFVAFIRSDR